MTLADASPLALSIADQNASLPTIPEEKQAPPLPPADVIQGYDRTMDAPRPTVVEDYLR